MAELGWMQKITEPGSYYFVGLFGDDARTVKVLNIEKDHEGILFATGCDKDWGWGPDPSRSAVSRPGLWKKIPMPNGFELRNFIFPALDKMEVEAKQSWPK